MAALSLRKKAGGAIVSKIRKGQYSSPLRADQGKPSFLVKQGRDGRWFWKDMATGDRGDMIDLVACGLHCGVDEAARLIDRKLGLGFWQEPRRGRSAKANASYLPNIKPRTLTESDALKIAACVGIDGTDSIWHLHKLGMLHVGDCWIGATGGAYPQADCWFLLDRATKSATARRLDGKPIGSYKSMCPSGWHKGPIGLGYTDKATFTRAVVAEGEKDLVALLHGYPKREEVLPICMPSVTTPLKNAALPETLELVRIYAQADGAGVEGAIRWATWAQDVQRVDVIVPKRVGADVADLMEGRTRADATALLLSDDFERFHGDRIAELSPSDYPKAEEHKLPPKQRGSPKNTERDKAVRQAIASLPPAKQASDTAICRVLGLEPNSSNRKKVYRSRLRVESGRS